MALYLSFAIDPQISFDQEERLKLLLTYIIFFVKLKLLKSYPLVNKPLLQLQNYPNIKQLSAVIWKQ